MKYLEAKSFVVKAAKLFPGQITDGQAPAMVKHFQACDRWAVEAAIEEHHRNESRIDWPKLAAACERTPTAAPASASRSAGEGSWFDVRRRQNPAYAGRSDVEVAIRVFWRQWHSSPKTDVYRRKLATECAYVLLTARPIVEGGAELNREDADKWAQVIFDTVDQIRVNLEYIRDTVPTPFMGSVHRETAAVAP